MTLESSYPIFLDSLSKYDKNEAYTLIANYFFENLRSELDAGSYQYSFEDLLDFNYVKEYLAYSPSDKILLLARTAHTILFLGC